MVSGPRYSEENGVSDIDASRSAISDSQNVSPEPGESVIGNEPQNTDAGAVARISDSNFRLPNLQSHQHASLFYLSLIEGRCRTQAANAVNRGRRPENHLPEDHPQVNALADVLFTQMSAELRQVGLLPPEVSMPNLRDLRRYLDTFDTRLSNIATRQPEGAYRAIAADSITSNAFSVSADGASSLFERSHHGPGQSSSIFNRDSYRIGADSNTFSFGGDASSSLFQRSQSQALIPQPFGCDIARQQTHSSLSSFMAPSGVSNGFRESSYARKFKEIRLLGKGGFGQVYCAQHVLDGQQYAVKKIRITAAQLRSIKSEVHAKPLLAELRALADLNHRNVVRYYDSWIEARLAVKSSQHLIGNGTFNSSDSEAASDSEEASRIETQDDTGLESLRIGLEQELKMDDKRRRRESQRERDSQRWTSEESGMILFETSSPKTYVGVGVAKLSKSSNGSMSHRGSLFRKPSEIESDNEDDTEELPRSDEGVSSGAEQDMIIFIQMALHPMTLEDYLWPDQQTDQSNPIPHCFHASTTARIVLAILDGIEYIHSKQIVHRDLKPSNIFLSVTRGKVPPEGAINITACQECPQSSSDENVYIIPHIGDFGLIAKLEDSNDLSVPPSSTSKPFKPSPIAVLSSVASSRQPGTRFYCAPDTAARVICPKLDIYSLGVIMVEMLWEFGTKTERHVVLGELAKGVMPAGMGDHALEPAVKGMLEKEREKRWDCARVRQFLQGLL